MDYKEFYLKFYKINSKMIKFIFAQDYYSDEMKLRKVAFFRNLNIELMRDLRKEFIHDKEEKNYACFR